MDTFPFLPYLLIILAILVGMGGLTFLIIGLVQNKRYYWLPGAIVLAIAIITGVIGAFISIRFIVTNVKKIIDNTEMKYDHKHKQYSDSFTSPVNPVDTTFAEAVSGFIDDFDDKLIYIRVFPAKDLASYDITLEKVEKGIKSKDIHKAICLVMNFDKNFSGKMKLTSFDHEREVTGISVEDVKRKQGESVNINFIFSDNVNFSNIEYYTLIIE